MKKFSTVLATMAVSAALVTTGVGAAGAASPETPAPADTIAAKASSVHAALDTEANGVRNSCVGKRLESKNLVNGYGTTIGRVELWYSSSAGPKGQNCVMTYNYLSGKNHTEASLFINDNRDNAYERKAEDIGWFYTYAGGAYLNNVNGKCAWFYGKVKGNNPNSTKDDAEYGSGWVRCG